jgi:hypothetical protein
MTFDFEEEVIGFDNIGIVQSQDSNSNVPIFISIDKFYEIYGDGKETLQLDFSQNECSEKDGETETISLFGSWEESGDEDIQLEELYKSRLNVSSLPDEDE